MAYTTFKYGVPYNTIRLGADVAQWTQHGQSYTDYNSFKPSGQVSMAQLQGLATSTANVDPGNGGSNYDSFPFVGKKWGIGRAGDASQNDGIFVGQAGGTSNWVGTRSYNMGGTIQNVKLSNLAGLDYTAVLELEGRVITSGQGIREDFVIMDQDFTQQWWSTCQPTELFTDEPLFGAAARDAVPNRYVYVLRTGLVGDKFSDLTEENWIRIENPTDTNDVLSMCAIRETLGSTYNSNIPAMVTAGRRTGNSSNVKVTLILYNKGSNGLSPSLTEGAQINVNYGSTNTVPSGLCYIADNRAMLMLTKGNSTTKIAGLSYGSGWAAGTVTSLGGGSTYGSLRGNILPLRDEYNPSNQEGEAIVIWAGNKSTYNSNIYAQRVRQNSTTLTTSTQRTLITNTNNIKCCNACVLAMDNANVWVAVIYSDTNGDGQLSVHKYSYGGDSWTTVGSTQQIDFNDTSLNNIISVAPMARNYKNQNQFSGETFIPGQSNNYDRIVWMKVLLATNQENDQVGEYHISINLDTAQFASPPGSYQGNISVGRNSWTMKNEWDTNGRKWCKGQWPLAGGNDWVMTVASYKHTSPGTVRATNMYVNGMDRAYDWNVITEDKTQYYTNPTGPSGSEYTVSTNVGSQGGPNSPSGGYAYGRWNIGPSIGKLNQNSFISSSRYATVEYYKKSEGFFHGSLGDGTNFIGFDPTDIDGNRWGDYFIQLEEHVKNGNTVTLKVTNGSNDTATFTINDSTGGGPTNRGEDEIIVDSNGKLIIRWTGGGNGFSGRSYSLWEGPSVNQLKFGFQFTA